MAPTTPTRSLPTIQDVETAIEDGLEQLRTAPMNAAIADALHFLVPAGYRAVVQLEEDGRRKRSTAASSTWNFTSGEVVIFFEPLQPGQHASRPANATDAAPQPRESFMPSLTYPAAPPPAAEPRPSFPAEVTETELAEVCAALADAERAGRAFISLKWFRDSYLIRRTVSQTPSWTQELARRATVLTRAIELGMIRTGTVANPKTPEFPTTTVTLNRERKPEAAQTPADAADVPVLDT